MQNIKKFKIDKNIVVICGGSGQLGKKISKFLKKNRAIIINFDLNKEKNSIFDEFFKTDITNESQVKLNIKRVIKKYKRIDTLINLIHYKGNRKLEPKNEFFSAFHNYDFKIWKKTLSVNLDGIFLVTREVLKNMIKRKKGVILNFSSTYGLVSPNFNIYGNSGINNPIGYTTTKGAIINFTKYIATHYAKFNIRANSICPGGILNNKQTKEFKKNYSKLTPLGRLANEEELNESVLFLISEASSYVTGTNLIVDGGWTAW